VVLVDFWASWCQPCRNNNPNLVEIHDKYKEQGFEIFSVSIDKDKTAWMAAISADKLFWPQVVDVEGWQSIVLSKFNIDYIPSNMLVDKNGYIRGYDLAKEDLDKLIPTLLKE
jgi:thiol-disulfide isomerase/thioredoxin